MLRPPTPVPVASAMTDEELAAASEARRRREQAEYDAWGTDPEYQRRMQALRDLDVEG